MQNPHHPTTGPIKNDDNAGITVFIHQQRQDESATQTNHSNTITKAFIDNEKNNTEKDYVPKWDICCKNVPFGDIS